MQALINPNIDKAKQEAILRKLASASEAEERQEAFRQARRGRITASEAHKLFTSSYKKANNKTSETYILKKVAEHFGVFAEHWNARATDWGNDHEEEAVQEYIKRTGNEVEKWGIHQEFVQFDKRLGATPDGIITNINACLQIKCPFSPAQHIKYLTFKDQKDLKAYSTEYYVQIQMELMATGATLAHWVTYDPRFDEKYRLKILEIVPDNETQAIMQEVFEAATTKIQDIIEQIKRSDCCRG